MTQGDVRWMHIHRFKALTFEGQYPMHADLCDLIGQTATEQGIILKSRTPEEGWATKAHSRDGKFWPCNEKTQGAVPVWIWKGRLR